LELFWHNFEPEMLKTLSRALKTRILAENPENLEPQYWLVGLAMTS